MLIEEPKDWKEILKLAEFFLQSASISEWTLGGGTALMLHYKHRLSRDIDIFFNNAQFITLLTPRLNDKVEKYVSDYDEQSNYLKLKFKESEIDFIVAPNLTGIKPLAMDIDGIAVRIDVPVEIVLKKMFYRPESLKVRDIFDLATVLKYDKESMFKCSDIIKGKFDLIQDRVEAITKTYIDGVYKLDILDQSLRANAPDVVKSFLTEIRRLSDKKV
ncbi:MAG: nucleotidyl transferase AbiEii/AbiGii toxin family protein [bacterium]